MSNLNPYAITLEALLLSQRADEHDVALLAGQPAALARMQTRMTKREKEIARVRGLYAQAEGLALDALDGAMTPAEIELVFGVKENTVRKAIKRGWIEARQSGTTWLVRRGDAEKRWYQKSKQARSIDRAFDSPPFLGG